MEEIMKVIVDADKQARLHVDEKKQECRDIQNLIQQQSHDIKKKYHEETQECVAKRRTELDDELDSQLKQEMTNYEEALMNLQKKYEDHKDSWVKEIFDRCLGL